MKKLILVFCVFIISACTLRASFIPEGDNLRNATVGVSYSDEINITGGAVASYKANGREVFVGDITPSDTGLYIQRCNGYVHNNNCVQVKGVPIKSGVVKVRVHGGLFGTNIAVGSGFDKTYSITINNPEGSS